MAVRHPARRGALGGKLSADLELNGFSITDDDILLNADLGGTIALRINSGNQFTIATGATYAYNNLWIRDGKMLRLYNSGNTAYAEIDVPSTGVDCDVNAGGTAEDLRFSNWTEINVFSGTEMRFWDSTNTDRGGLKHDGADFNLNLTNTVNFDIRGGTRVLINDMQLRLDSRGSGASKEIEVMYDDNAERIIMEIVRETGAANVFRINATTTGALKFIDMQNSGRIYLHFVPNSDVRVRDGNEFRVYDGGDTDYISLSNDGTDSNIGNGNARALNINGAPLAVSQTIYMAERAAEIASRAAFGQLWVKTATPNQLWFTDDAGTSTQIV